MVLHKLTLPALIATAISGAAWTAELPRKCPDFVIHMADGNSLPLSQYRGKVLVVAFIHTTCPHCQRYTQILTAIQKEYGPRGVQILASAFSDGAKGLVPAFVQQYQPNFPVGWNDFPAVLSFLQISILRGPGYVPKVVFIDRAAMIRQQFEGQDEFFKDPEKGTRAALDDLLKTPVAHKKTAVKSSTKQQ